MKVLLIVLTDSTFLLGQTRVEALNQAIKERESTIDFTGLILLGMAVLAIVLATAIYFFVKYRDERVVNDERMLFQELCRKHQLDFGQRRLLRKLARVKKIEHPSTLMIDSNLWQICAETSGQLCNAATRNRLQRIRSLLFEPEKTTIEIISKLAKT